MRGSFASVRALRRRSCSAAMPVTGFKGFCGDTSHQTSSSPSFLKAVRLISRCPAWAGLKEPPRIPTRRGARRGLGRLLRPNLACPADDIFDAGKLFGSDRSTGMQLAGGDADLRTHPKLATVGKLRGGINHDDACIDGGQEPLGRGRVLGDDCFGMARPMLRDMPDYLLNAVHDAHGDNGIEIFGVPVLRRCRLYARIDSLGLGIAAHLAAGCDEIGTKTGRWDFRTRRSTNRVSVAPQIPVRRILALRLTRRAIARSAAPST